MTWNEIEQQLKDISVPEDDVKDVADIISKIENYQQLSDGDQAHIRALPSFLLAEASAEEASRTVVGRLYSSLSLNSSQFSPVAHQGDNYL